VIAWFDALLDRLRGAKDQWCSGGGSPVLGDHVITRCPVCHQGVRTAPGGHGRVVMEHLP
jgi:hypothetical protein